MNTVSQLGVLAARMRIKAAVAMALTDPIPRGKPIPEAPKSVAGVRETGPWTKETRLSDAALQNSDPNVVARWLGSHKLKPTPPAGYDPTAQFKPGLHSWGSIERDRQYRQDMNEYNRMEEKGEYPTARIDPEYALTAAQRPAFYDRLLGAQRPTRHIQK